ncbi:MAG: ribosome-associated translation inhibitor RaiA [Myxococcaceae bacterium]|nr:ribosome-associated translation inhibitor RaiA [Myxococcaceae bacterium]MBH2005831.1 ribosome-associated translation inhibitor RaiA [Myxococcaceae bacterium]
MQISVTFRHLEATEALRQHAVDKINNHLKKYTDDSAYSHVVLSADKHGQKAEIQISSHGMLIRGKGDSSDLYNSIDRAVEKLENQIRRYRDRLSHHKVKEGARKRVTFNTLAEIDAHSSNLPANIIESKEVEARPMMLDEACLQMDLLGSEILVFLNAKTEHLNILYRKKNQKFGLIEAV